MKISKLILKNYRKFSNFEYDFENKNNLITGYQSCGKTTIISSLCQSLSFILARDKNKKLASVIDGFPDNMLPFNKEDINTDYKRLREDYNYYGEFPISVDLTANMDNNEAVTWKLLSNDYYLEYEKELYESGANKFWEYYKDNIKPILAYYSVYFSNEKIEPRKKIYTLLNDNGMPQYMGYYQFMDDEKDTNLWLLYILRNEKCKEYVKKYLLNACIFYKKICKFNVILNTKNKPELSLEFEDGSAIISSKQLSSGMRRILFILIDILVRSYILNGDKEPTGIVMIDEIEMHLTLSTSYIFYNELMNMFPNIQFIVTTNNDILSKYFENNKTFKIKNL